MGASGCNPAACYESARITKSRETTSGTLDTISVTMGSHFKVTGSHFNVIGSHFNVIGSHCCTSKLLLYHAEAASFPLIQNSQYTKREFCVFLMLLSLRRKKEL